MALLKQQTGNMKTQKTETDPRQLENQINSIEDLKEEKELLNLQIKALKEKEKESKLSNLVTKKAKKELRELNKQSFEAKKELLKNWEDEFKNPFKLYNFYSKNIELIRVREKRSELPLLSKEQFFKLFDGAKENKKIERLELLEQRKQEAISLNDLTKVNSIDKQIIKTQTLPIDSFKLPFTLPYLLKLIK